MLTRGTAPPMGVMLSCMQLIDPVEVPVVESANKPQPTAPNRVSLPSMFPPDWTAVARWSAPEAARLCVPRASNGMAIRAPPSHRANMAAKTTHPCFWSVAIFPKAKGKAKGTARIIQMMRMSVIGLGFSNGWAALAL